MAVEREATHRAIALSELVDVPILIVHVSGREAIEQIRWAHGRGLRIYAETCPQYLFLTAEDLGIDGLRGRQVRLQPAAARQGQPARHVGRAVGRALHHLLVRPRAVPLRRSAGQEAGRQGGAVPPHPERHPGAGDAAAAAVLARACAPAASTSTSSWRSPPPTRRGSTACIRARAPSRSAPTPTSRSGTRTRQSHDRATACSTTTWTTRPTRACGSRGWPVTTLSRGERGVGRRRVLRPRGHGQFLPCGKPDMARPKVVDPAAGGHYVGNLPDALAQAGAGEPCLNWTQRRSPPASARRHAGPGRGGGCVPAAHRRAQSGTQCCGGRGAAGLDADLAALRARIARGEPPPLAACLWS